MGKLLGIHEVYRNGQNIGSLTVTQDGLMTRFVCECELRIDGVLRLAGVSGGEYVRLGVLAPEGGILVYKKSFTKSALASKKLEPEVGFFAVLQDEVFAEVQTGTKKSGNEKQESTQPDIKAKPVPSGMRTDRPREVFDNADESIPSVYEKTNKGKNPPKIPRAEDVPVELPREANEKPQEPAPRWEWSPIPDPSVLFDDEDIAAACKDAKGALTMEKDGITLLAIPVIPGEPFPMMPIFCFGDSMMIDGREYIIFKSKNGNFTV